MVMTTSRPSRVQVKLHRLQSYLSWSIQCLRTTPVRASMTANPTWNGSFWVIPPTSRSPVGDQL